MEIACSNNETTKCYQEVNTVRKSFRPQTLLNRDKECNIESNKEKVM